jgi:hypothetical protein
VSLKTVSLVEADDRNASAAPEDTASSRCDVIDRGGEDDGSESTAMTPLIGRHVPEVPGPFVRKPRALLREEVTGADEFGLVVAQAQVHGATLSAASG